MASKKTPAKDPAVRILDLAKMAADSTKPQALAGLVVLYTTNSQGDFEFVINPVQVPWTDFVLRNNHPQFATLRDYVISAFQKQSSLSP